MFPNLLDEKIRRNLSDEDMGKIIGVSRSAFGRKMKSGRFFPEECRKICDYFGMSFEYLFALTATNPERL